MMLLLCGLLWLSAVAVQADELDCSDRMDVIDVTQWPFLQGFEQDVLNSAKLVAVGLITVNEELVQHAVLHTTDLKTYMRDPCDEAAVTREIVEMRGLAVKDIRFGKDFIVILTEAGSVWTAGRNGFGQLGHHGTDSQKLFFPVEGLPKIKQVATGAGQHCVVLTHNGQLMSWGANNSYRLGYPSAQSANPVPKTIPLTADLFGSKYVCCGAWTCTALTENNKVVTWGQGGHDKRSFNDELPGLVRGIPPSDEMSQISCGEVHTLAVTSTGRLYGWGHNVYGELLQAPSTGTNATMLDLGGKLVRGVLAGRFISIIKTSSKEAEYFGWYNGEVPEPRQACALKNPLDVLSRSQYSWGAVQFGCKAGEDEMGKKTVLIKQGAHRLTVNSHGEIVLSLRNC